MRPEEIAMTWQNDEIRATGIGGLPGRRRTGPFRMSADDETFWEHESRYLYGEDGIAGGTKPLRDPASRSTRLRLYTATIAATHENIMVQAFHASIARSVAEVRARLAGRYGPHLADGADIRIGLHQSSPLVVALVPRAVVEMIGDVQQRCREPDLRRFGVDIQQCIHA